MSQVVERHEALSTAFEAFKRDAAFGDAAAGRAREQALDAFFERGFPTTRDEEWRFTNVAPIAKTSFVRAPAATVPHDALAPYLIPGLPAIVIVNGRLKSTSEVDFVSKTAISGHFATKSTSEVDFGRLNLAFAEEIITIDVPAKTVARDPIQIVCVNVAGTVPVMASPRIVIRIGEGAQASVVERYVTIGRGVTWTNAVTEVHVAPGGVLHHVKIQEESSEAFHIAALSARLDRASTFASRSLTFGGRITRNDISAVLDGEGAECTLDGLYVAGGDAVVDNHTSIDHAKPHCPSHEVYKGILSGHARAVFNGKIVVRQDAQKTNAKQTNKALLLSDDAQVNTKPQLEIFADDVKCTHGAAIGQLDEDALFYLRARGISESDARNLLIHAFAGQVLDGITDDRVQETTKALLDQALGIRH